jgi:hypothetical protein
MTIETFVVFTILFVVFLMATIFSLIAWILTNEKFYKAAFFFGVAILVTLFFGVACYG